MRKCQYRDTISIAELSIWSLCFLWLIEHTTPQHKNDCAEWSFLPLHLYKFFKILFLMPFSDSWSKQDVSHRNFSIFVFPFLAFTITSMGYQCTRFLYNKTIRRAVCKCSCNWHFIFSQETSKMYFPTKSFQLFYSTIHCSISFSNGWRTIPDTSNFCAVVSKCVYYLSIMGTVTVWVLCCTISWPCLCTQPNLCLMYAHTYIAHPSTSPKGEG